MQRTDPIQILFGSESNDVWTGSHYADHLYGEGGDDLLSGGEGNDYLEGGKGNDRLAGDDGNDILIGAAGNDTLLAGSGSNRLEGGAGFDSYEVVSGGLQVISDLDGSGRIKLDDVVLNGGARTGANRFASEDGSVQYTVVGDLVAGATLQISGGITVENFHDGDLGIALDGTVNP
jgi:Ca2+-binding RTX toxin-like protein